MGVNLRCKKHILIIITIIMLRDLFSESSIAWKTSRGKTMCIQTQTGMYETELKEMCSVTESKFAHFSGII